MLRDFEELLRTTRSEKGAAAAALLRLRIVVDMAKTGCVERLTGRGGGRRDEQDGALARTVLAGRQAVRRLRRAPGYATAFVLTLGLAIGVNSAVFSVVNGVILQPLPFPEADRMLFIKHAAPGLGLDIRPIGPGGLRGGGPRRARIHCRGHAPGVPRHL